VPLLRNAVPAVLIALNGKRGVLVGDGRRPVTVLPRSRPRARSVHQGRPERLFAPAADHAFHRNLDRAVHVSATPGASPPRCDEALQVLRRRRRRPSAPCRCPAG
jgi:hypothetical protein